MQNRSYASQPIASTSKPNTSAQAISQTIPQKDDLTRIFNTALVATQAAPKKDYSAELFELTESASFKAIISAVRQLSCVQGISERQAAEQIIQTFRRMDIVWGGYVFNEGLDRLRNSR